MHPCSSCRNGEKQKVEDDRYATMPYVQGRSQKILWEGASQKKIWFFRIFLLKKIYFCYFLNKRLPINKKSEHLKVWAINKNKNLMGIAQKN
jgi:hypothetical protein